MTPRLARLLASRPRVSPPRSGGHGFPPVRSTFAHRYFTDCQRSPSPHALLQNHSWRRVVYFTKMVKVLENQIVDLDVLPGTKEDQLQAQVDKLSSAPLLLSPSTQMTNIRFPHTGNRAPRISLPKPARQSNRSSKAPRASVRMHSIQLAAA